MIGTELWHVEVKGSTRDPLDVILTPNEVAHADRRPQVALCVPSNIEIDYAEQDNVPVASGGKQWVFEPWSLDHEQLTPLGHQCSLPGV
jgi:hypothetical protein